MHYPNSEIHNIEEARLIEGNEGLRLQRVPESVRAELNPKAQDRMLSPDCGEIRFVCEDGPARITLSSAGVTETATFYGGFQKKNGGVSIGRETQTIEIHAPDLPDKLTSEYTDRMPFHPRVCRLILGRPASSPIFLHTIEGDIRAPQPAELPQRRLLTYGTSITHGAAASRPYLSYAAQTAWRLGADLINLGVGGSAYCEHAISDYIAERRDWNIGVLSLSVNMIGGGFSNNEFAERVGYMINTVAESDTSRPVFCITLYPHHRDFSDAMTDNEKRKKSSDFRDILRQTVKDCPHPNVHMVEGPDMLDDITGLTDDLIHPSDLGMIRMGENLARIIESTLSDR